MVHRFKKQSPPTNGFMERFKAIKFQASDRSTERRRMNIINYAPIGKKHVLVTIKRNVNPG
jgi:hypothetical protein